MSEIRRLLQRGADVNEREGPLDQWTALMYAARDGHLDAARLLLEKGAGVDQKAENDGLTALHVAAYNGQVEVAKELLRAGASTDIRNNANKTALDLANERNNSAVSSVIRDPQRWRQRPAPAVVSFPEVRSRGTVR